MQQNENFSIFNISDAESARFRRIVLDVMTKACAIPDDEYGGIGRLSEKQMHAAIKCYICPDERCHEVKIDVSDTDKTDGSAASEDKKRKTRKFVADILRDGTIYEIQTGSFSPLRQKIKWILENTDYNIVLVHPIAEQKWISTISRDGRIVGQRKKSPQKGSLRDLAGELYFISEFIPSPRFSLVILMVEGEQYRKNIAKEGARARYRKYELIPTSLLRAHIFRCVEDYRAFIPDDLPNLFTVKDFSAKSKIYGIDAYSIVKSLCSLGLLEQSGNIGRAAAYKKVPFLSKST